ncbi:MAG TPA: pentapeptide repeat-containing protein [Polyangiaceae bacterium]|nr:pentapeptide repeat-containing protein [Polyangiaceae bacterium]
MSSRLYTRVAVAQIAAHPAITSTNGRSPLEDPLFGAGPPDTLVPEGEPAPELDDLFKGLRSRVRAAYLEHLRGKVGAILEQCIAWGVRVVVFPEYSIPREVLSYVAGLSARADHDLIIVAGTHTVDRAARKQDPYRALGAERAPPLGQAICPVLHRGRLLALQPKLHPAAPEVGQMKPGDCWAPVTMPEGLPGPMGVLVCLDFLYRDSGPHRALVGEPLESCRFLAVPSWTPTHTLSEFAAKAWEEARRYGRPVLYADTAGLGGNEGGGTSVFVDEGRPSDLRDFPKQVGLLDVGEEGVIVADVDLGFRRSGESRPYDWQRPVRPFAAASLVYRNHPAGAAYADWLEVVAPALNARDGSDVEGLSERVAESETLLLNAASLGGAMRGRRLRRLAREHGDFLDLEQFRLSTREVVLPAEALPLPAVRAAMAAAASDVVFEWLKEYRHPGLAELAERLRRAGESAGRLGPAEWTEPARQALAALRDSVLGDELRAPAAPAPDPPVLREVPVIPAGVDPASLGERERDGLRFQFFARVEELKVEYTEGALRDDGQGESEVELPAELDPEITHPETSPEVRSRFRREYLAALKGFRSAYRFAVATTRELLLVATAETGGPCAVVAVMSQGARFRGLGVLAAERASGGWVLLYDPRKSWWKDVERVRAALEAEGLRPLRALALGEPERAERKAALRPMFAGALGLVAERRAFKLKEVGGHFVEPTLQTDEARLPAFRALGAWLESPAPTALLLGEFGSGKSTLLAEWCAGLAERAASGGPIPVLVDLATAPSGADATGALLAALSLPDDRRHRAAATLLVGAGHLLPCFDGFDEMAGRVGQQGLAERLRDLVQIASHGGKVLVASRDHYFASESELRTATAEALAGALGGATEYARLVVQPFDQGQVEALVRGVRGDAQGAREALRRIATTYDLNDLVRRPLLLAMVLASLDRIDPGARVAPADVYEAYLERWLEQTAEDEASLSHDQKIHFAEALAEQLWRSGAAACSWQELRRSVRDRISNLVLPDHLPARLAFLDIQGGAFFVHEGEDRYRFAHRSFLEYFLARALVTTMRLRPYEALATRPLTPEVVGFVGEVLRSQGDPREAPAIHTVRRLLTNPREAVADAGAARALSDATSNALRLLHGLARWSSDPRGWVPENANLCGASLIGEDLRGALLRSARLSDADLSGADLSGADLRRARLVAARLDDALLDGADARLADLTMAAADRCRLRGARFDGATLAQSLWTHGQWEGARLDGADLTATVFAGGSAPSTLQPEIVARTASPLAARVVLARRAIPRPRSIAWDPTGRRLAVGGWPGKIAIFDTVSGRSLRTFEQPPDIVKAVAFDPSGRTLASGADRGAVRLWEASSGRLLRTLEGHSDDVNAMAFDPSGRTLVTGSSDDTVRLWEVASGKLLRTLEGHSDNVWAVAFDPGGRTLASGAGDKKVRLWEAASGKLLRTLEGHSGAVTAVAFDPGGRALASGSVDMTVRLWEASSGELLRTLEGHSDGITAVAFDPSGHTLASGAAGGTLWLWEPSSGQPLRTLGGHSGWVQTVAFDPGGHTLASGSDDGTVRLWEASSGRLMRTLGARWGEAWAAAFDPSGRTLASTTHNHAVRLWEVSSGRLLRSLEGHSEVITAVAFDPSGHAFASGAGDGTVRLWEATSGRLLHTLEPQTAAAWGLAFDPGGHTLASGASDGTVRLWEVASGRLLRTLGKHPRWVHTVAFDPGGRTLATGAGDSAVRLWEVSSGQLLRMFEGHPGGVRAVAFDPGGHTLASGGDDDTLRLWEVSSGRLLHALEGHSGAIVAVAFDPGGHTLASGAGDGMVRLWEATSGRPLRVLEGHSDGVWAVSFDPSGRTLASGSRDGTARIWDVKRGATLAILSSDGASGLVESQGYFRFDGDERLLALGLPNPKTPGSILFLQTGRLRDVLENPARVEAALAGNPPTPEQLAADLDAAGLTSPGGAWDGEIVRVPAANDEAADAPPPSLPALETTAPAPSPFRPGPALTDVDALAGREPVVAELSSLALSKSPAILVGPRRSGKTSLLHLVRRRLKGGPTVCYVTLQQAKIATADDLAKLLASALAAETGEPARHGPRTANESLRDTLTRELRATGAPAPVFLLDEVACLKGADGELFPWLRALGQDVASLIYAGSPLDWESTVRHANEVAPGSSFGNDVTRVSLGPIPEADAKAFLVETAAGIISPEVARWVIEFCGPWPFYLQVMGHALLTAANSGQRGPLLRKDSLRELYEQRLLIERTIFLERWNELPKPVRGALLAHPDERPALRSLPTAVRTQVIDAGLCTVTGVWLPDRPFFDWIRMHAAVLEAGPESKPREEGRR